MQRVARVTAAENKALRSLLASQGLTATEINAHVHAAIAALDGMSLDPEEKLAQQPRISERTKREQQAYRPPKQPGSQHNRCDSLQSVHPNRPEPPHSASDNHPDLLHTDHLSANSQERHCGLGQVTVPTPEA